VQSPLRASAMLCQRRCPVFAAIDRRLGGQTRGLSRSGAPSWLHMWSASCAVVASIVSRHSECRGSAFTREQHSSTAAQLSGRSRSASLSITNTGRKPELVM
jgi:hypothetical protein